MRYSLLFLVALVATTLPGAATADPERVLVGKDTAHNIEVRLIAARISEARGQNLIATFMPVKGEQKEVTLRFPSHSHTTLEATLMKVIYACTAARPDLGHEWKKASMEAVFSVPRDFTQRPNDLSHWYLVSLKVADKK